jgi:hypothetical protein
MGAIEEVIGAIKYLELREKSYQSIANGYCVHRATLSRRHQGLQSPRKTRATHQLKLNTRQELELMRYIKRLKERGLLPTREMISKFSSESSLSASQRELDY